MGLGKLKKLDGAHLRRVEAASDEDEIGYDDAGPLPDEVPATTTERLQSEPWSEESRVEGRRRYMMMMPFVVGMAANVPDLQKWWRDEAANRRLLVIKPGAPEYDALVSLCARRREAIENEVNAAPRLC